MASRAPCSTWTSVCLFHSGGPVLCMYLCRSCGVSRVPTPPPRWNCYGSGRAFREGGVMLEFVSCVSCVPASCFLIWFVSCHYWLIRVQVCVICECVFKSCLLNSISSGLLVIPGVSTLPCLPLMLSLKTIILKYFLVCVFLISPCCVHRDIG